MLVPIVSASGKLEEWAMVELQGRLESLTGEPVSEIGTLQVSPLDKDVVQLIIGYHQLEGKRVPLKKPFAILEKVEVPSSSQSTHREDSACPQEQSQGGDAQVQYQAVGVVRSKLLFKTRPTALISKPARR